MLEIIPNWHPIFVNFTIALLTMSVIFYWACRIVALQRWHHEFLIVARWCLWSAAILTIVTVCLGFYAYYTVAHNDVSHALMTTHRNWALAAFIILWITTIWSWFIFRNNKKPNLIFLIALLVAFASVAVTAWQGAELVFRHGVGVVAVPKAQGHDHKADHQHQHQGEHSH